MTDIRESPVPSKITDFFTSPEKDNAVEETDTLLKTPESSLPSHPKNMVNGDAIQHRDVSKNLMTPVSKIVKNSHSSNSPRARMNRKKKTVEPGQNNKLVTDYFPVRRSCRKPKSEIEKERKLEVEEKILQKIEDGLEVVNIEQKGRGVVATKQFKRGDFVIEYAGDLIDLTTAKQRDEEYSKNPDFGCYMYYFVFKNKNYCIDATMESGRLGRLINHSKSAGNCHTKLTEINNRPYLMLIASRDISIGEELLYDYGDRNKASLESHPWLKH